MTRLMIGCRFTADEVVTCHKSLAEIHAGFDVLPASARCCANVGLMLGQRRRRWANNKAALAQRLAFAGLVGSWVSRQTRNVWFNVGLMSGSVSVAEPTFGQRESWPICGQIG